MNEYPNNLQVYDRPRRGCGSVFLGMLAALGVIAIVAVGAWTWLAHQHPGTAANQGSEVMMPYVVNTQSEVARSLLEQDGFVVTGYTFSKSYRKEEWGIVKEQPLEAGKYYPRGTKVKLVVWGEEDSTTTTTKRNVAVPSLIGEYEDYFDSHKNPGMGFRFRYVPSDQPYGTIVGQSIDPGVMVPEDTDMCVYVSGGPTGLILRDVVGRSINEATASLEWDKLNVEVIEEPNDGDHQSGSVKSTSPEPGSPVEKGDTITLYVWK